MNYFLLKLAFDTAVHFGGSDSAVGSQSSALTLRADTIFSALCHTALEVYGEPALEELLVSADADALRISDAMPWRGDSFYLPKPIAASTSPAELSTVERKAVKKLAWIPASKFDRYTASLHSGTYPLDELDQRFGQAYEQTKASVTDGAAADDILDSIFRGVQVSDSAPIDNDKLILTGRTLISPLSAARVEDFDGDAKDLPLYQECVRPGETIRFRLTLDQSILNRYAHPITKDALLEAIAEFSRFYQDAFLSHFPQGHPVANIPDTPHLILGGGTGFLSKTVGYPYLKDDYAATLQRTVELTRALPEVCNHKDGMPQRFVNGVNAALLAPTAMNQQKFFFTLQPDGSVKAACGKGFYTKLDLGIVKYHFELGSGRKL
mgnify:CR=1 FL=1